MRATWRCSTLNRPISSRYSPSFRPGPIAMRTPPPCSRRSGVDGGIRPGRTTNSGHGNDRLSSIHVCRQILHQGVECDLAAGAVAQVFMHRDPGVEFKFEFVRQHANEVRVAPGERHLADTDAAAGTHERELAHVAVCAY